MATQKVHHPDSFVTGAYDPDLTGPLDLFWLCTSVGLTSVLYQVTILTWAVCHYNTSFIDND